jgi:hypothetical protein
MVKPTSKFHHDHCICDTDIDTIERYRGEETKTKRRRIHQPATAPGGFSATKSMSIFKWYAICDYAVTTQLMLSRTQHVT